MWKILAAASTALALIGSPALAQTMDWDANADASIDETEFGTGFAEGDIFGTWDMDDDSMLSQEEFDAGWAEGVFDEATFGAFGDWDADADTFLSQDEFEAGVFGGYDADDSGMLSQDEFGAYEADEWF